MKVLKKIIGLFIILQIFIVVFGSGAVVMAETRPNEEFKVSEILVLPGQKKPKFLEKIDKEDSQAPIITAIIYIVDFAIKIIGSFAFLVMVAGGIVMLSSGGNDQQAEQGKNMMIYSVVGLIVAFSSFIISAFVQSLITGT